MKRLLITVFAAALCGVSFGAQCEGKTLEGVRCKRDAAEGSRFCIGHADQAKAPKAESKKETPAKKAEAKPVAKTAETKPAAAAGEMKDDGTCWAVTEAGTRCKHTKDGESDYCKQHGVNVKATTPGGVCRAFTWEGTRCTRTAEGDSLYCHQHRQQKPAAKQKGAGPQQ